MISGKVGLHIIGDGFPVSQLGKPRIVKCVDSGADFIRRVRAQVGTACEIVVRWYEANQDLSSPIDAARAWFAKHAGEMAALAGVDPLIEGWNEISDSQAEAFCAFEIERMRLMHEKGYRVGVGSFSVGCPDIPIWATYRPMLEAMKIGDRACLHEYWIDTADISNPWHCARWTLIPQLKDVPLAISEAGRDEVEARGKPGWKRTCNADTFLLDLGLYGEILDRYPNVLGATVFQAGSLDPKWAAFDVADIWPQVVSQYAAEVAPAPTPQPPAPDPKPPTPAGIPVDGRLMSAEEFERYVGTLYLGDVRKVVIHHTAAPDEPTWVKHGGWPYWMKVLKRFYESKSPPWDKGPHLFVGPDGIGLFYDLEKAGRAVGGGYLERGCRHIEIVGDFTKTLPTGIVLENAVRAAAALLKAAGLTMLDGLTNHSDAVGGWPCPGEKLKQEWGWFQRLVREEMEAT